MHMQESTLGKSRSSLSLVFISQD